MASQQFHGVSVHHELPQRCILGLQFLDSLGLGAFDHRSSTLIAGVRDVAGLGVVVDFSLAVEMPDVLCSDVLSCDVVRSGSDEVDVHRHSCLSQDLGKPHEVGAVVVCCEEGILWDKLSSMG